MFEDGTTGRTDERVGGIESLTHYDEAVTTTRRHCCRGSGACVVGWLVGWLGGWLFGCLVGCSLFVWLQFVCLVAVCLFGCSLVVWLQFVCLVAVWVRVGWFRVGWSHLRSFVVFACGLVRLVFSACGTVRVGVGSFGSFGTFGVWLVVAGVPSLGSFGSLGSLVWLWWRFIPCWGCLGSCD